MRRLTILLLFGFLAFAVDAWADFGWARCLSSDTDTKWTGTEPTCGSTAFAACPKGDYLWIANLTPEPDTFNDCHIVGIAESDTLNSVFARPDGNKITNPTLSKAFRLGPDNGEHEDTYLDGGAFYRRRLNAVGSPVGVTTTVETGTTNTLGYGSVTSPTTCETMTSAGVQAYANACKPMKTIYFPAIAIEPDGNDCGPFVAVTMNGGPIQQMFSCVDSSSSRFFGSIAMLRTGWDGGPIQFTLHVFHASTETITFAGDFAAQCHPPGETVDNTWGTGVAADVAITTANRVARATTTDVTPAGTCAPGDMIYWRYMVDSANFSTNATNSRVFGVSLHFRTSTRDGLSE